MKSPKNQCKCLNCNELSVPNYRSGERQRFCPKADCQKARKRASQKAWLAKPENQNYFREADHATRVRQWQKEHPGYWKNSTRSQRRTLQDACPKQPIAPQGLSLPLRPVPYKTSAPCLPLCLSDSSRCGAAVPYKTTSL